MMNLKYFDWAIKFDNGIKSLNSKRIDSGVYYYFFGSSQTSPYQTIVFSVGSVLNNLRGTKGIDLLFSCYRVDRAQ